MVGYTEVKQGEVSKSLGENPGIEGHFRKWKIKDFFKIMMITIAYWYQIKGPIIICHLKGHAVKLKCVDYKIF